VKRGQRRTDLDLVHARRKSTATDRKNVRAERESLNSRFPIEIGGDAPPNLLCFATELDRGRRQRPARRIEDAQPQFAALTHRKLREYHDKDERRIGQAASVGDKSTQSTSRRIW
jgi:hypothetical protein